MISNSDGSIILSTKVDQTGLNTGMSQIQAGAGRLGTVFKRLGSIISSAFAIYKLRQFIKESNEAYRLQATNELKLATVLRQRTNATDKQIESVKALASEQQKLGIIGDEIQLAGAQQLSTFVKQTDSVEKLIPAMNNLVAQQYGYEASASSATSIANMMGKVLMGQTAALRRVGITFSDAQAKVLQYGNESERAAMLARIITENVGEMNQALANTDIGRQKQLANVFGDIKEQLGQSFTRIATVFIPVMESAAEVLETVAGWVEEFANWISGAFGEKTAKAIKRTASGINGLGKNINRQKEAVKANVNATTKLTKAQTKNTKETKKATNQAKKNAKQNKKNKKELQDTIGVYDKLNIIQKQFAETAQAVSETKPVSETQATPTASDYGIVPAKDDGGAKMKAMKGRVKKQLQDIGLVAGPLIAALGLILLATGHIPLGLAMVIAGATLFVKSAAKVDWGNKLNKRVKEKLTTIGTISGIALVALGLILCLTGVGVPLGIGMILAGGALLAGAVSLNWDYWKKQLDKFWKWLKNSSIYKFVVGIGDFIGGAFKTIKNGLSNGLDMVRDLLNGDFTSFKKHFAKYLLQLNEDSGKAFNTFVNMFINAINTAIDVLNGFISLGHKSWKWIYETFSGKKVPKEYEKAWQIPHIPEADLSFLWKGYDKEVRRVVEGWFHNGTGYGGGGGSWGLDDISKLGVAGGEIALYIDSKKVASTVNKGSDRKSKQTGKRGKNKTKGGKK